MTGKYGDMNYLGVSGNGDVKPKVAVQFLMPIICQWIEGHPIFRAIARIFEDQK